ncbi:MAG: bifunctional 2-polyprenyl-6-hydroxyphenol methylase/3-demethylubiquinol 3-O-methyltransferase UbiG [Alphaproteobacteria bacterium]
MAARTARRAATPVPPPAGGTADAAEVARFAIHAEGWWDPHGAFAPLHRLNPVRVAWVRDRLVRHFDRDPRSIEPFADLALLDVGCGGGLVAEPMARLGARVTGLDAEAGTLAVARAHAAAGGLAIAYRDDTVEALAASGARFDIVLALEVVEHVADLPAFLAACAAMLAPGGMLVLSTINRTAKSYALGIVAAERILRWVPAGTHDWKKFVKPGELVRALRAAGLSPVELCGLAYDPLARRWHEAPGELSVNYFCTATKPA